jgi:hypothetical protein
VDNCYIGGICKDHKDYENIVHPILDDLLIKCGVKKQKTKKDLGGINKEGEILYLPNSSPKEFLEILGERKSELPENHYYLRFDNFSGNYPGWKEAFRKEKLVSFESGTNFYKY